MTYITQSVFSMMIGFLLSVSFGSIFVPFLRKKKAKQTLSIYLEEAHRSKVGTPTMGGFIFILPCIFTMLFFYVTGKLTFSYSGFLLLFSFLTYSVIGFIDDFLIVIRGKNQGLSESQKFLLQLFVAVFFFYFFMISGNEPLLWIHTFHIKWNIGWAYGVFILCVLSSSSNAVNLTDGLDGLAGGLSAIAVCTFGIISWNTGWLEGYEELAICCFTLFGSLLGFLVYNVSPAKVFMGDTGSLALGAFLGSIAILTRHELLLVLIGLVFVLETVSCLIQRTYYHFTKKRVFPMTPIHHSFEKWGYSEREIVKLFWGAGLLASMAALAFGVWL